MKEYEKQEHEIEDVEIAINNKIYDFIDKYNQYPKYLKLPLWISNCLKRNMNRIVQCNINYNSALVTYKNLIVCETITISQLEEIEVF